MIIKMNFRYIFFPFTCNPQVADWVRWRWVYGVTLQPSTYTGSKTRGTAAPYQHWEAIREYGTAGTGGNPRFLFFAFDTQSLAIL
jgi:hypothetical protein